MLKPYLRKLVDREDLPAEEASEAMRLLMAGEAEDAQIAALLIAWRMKGETASEILGCARIMREKAESFGPVPESAVDTCGTGGDAAGTFNISTLSGFVAAAAGVPVAKHGNRKVSSRCGSADLLQALGVKPDAGREVALRCLHEVRFAFLFAPEFHRAMRHVAPARRALGTRSIFNLLGPLANPARVRRQVLGVFHERYLEPMAEVLRGLGAEHALVVHSRDGLDELTVCEETDLVELGPGGKSIRRYRVRPEDFGLARGLPGDLRGGNTERNVAIATEILDGKRGSHRDAVVLNAAAALYVGGAAGSLSEGVPKAEEAIDSGAAARVLDRLRALAPETETPAQRTGGER